MIKFPPNVIVRGPVQNPPSAPQMQGGWSWGLSLTPANLFIWNQQDCANFTSAPQGSQAPRPNKAVCFVPDEKAHQSAAPCLIKWMRAHQNLPSEQVFQNNGHFQDSLVDGKRWKKKKKSRRTRRSELQVEREPGTALKHCCWTQGNSSFLLNYSKCFSKCFSFLLAQVPTGGGRKLCDIAASCVFSETN